MNYFELLVSQQKWGIFKKNKVLQKEKFSKSVNNKECAPKIILYDENIF
jgi:hypothetical protein